MFQTQRFADLALVIAREPQLTANEARVLLYLACHWTRTTSERVFPTLCNIMDATGIKAMATLRAALDGLKEIGALEIESGTSKRFVRKGERKANTYTITDDPARWTFPDKRMERAAAGTALAKRQRKYEDAWLARKAAGG